jgi:hypothetical protein
MMATGAGRIYPAILKRKEVSMRRTLIAALGIAIATSGQAQPTAKIVGLGAQTCAEFNEEIAATQTAELYYFAWAQGFMSGALIRAPAGLDEGLDLTPHSFPLQGQVDFLRVFCSKNPEQDYMDAVRALYRRLRGPGI